MSRELVWIIDDDQSSRRVLAHACNRADIMFNSFKSVEEAIGAFSSSCNPDALIVDVSLIGISGIELLHFLTEKKQRVPPIIIITAYADLDTAISVYDSGAFEYLPKPFDVNEVVDVTRRAFCQTQSASSQTEPCLPTEPTEPTELIGEAPALQNVFRAIGRLSRTNATVLISGESGTGKELIARALHQNSPRSNEPFVALNMAAISHDLMESELFGHEKGAFTGAIERRPGRFEQADKGTLFLDEIGDMPATLQGCLLRVLSEKQFFRVGGRKPVKVDVRIIVATHQDLEVLVKQKLFREDLYHRLNVIRIVAPALRDRASDIPLLLKTFLQRFAKELESEVKTAKRELNDHLQSLPWPGNVRQLENLAHWLAVMTSARELGISDLPDDLAPDSGSAQIMDKKWVKALREWARDAKNDGQPIVRQATEEFERTLIEFALEQTGNRKQQAATLLGWGRNTLSRKIKDYNIN